MALVDLKSKLNEFGKNNPDNPYQKGDRRGDLENSPTPDIDKDKYLEVGEQAESELTKLDSKLDRENTPKSAIGRDESKKSRIKQNIEDFGLSSFDVPTSDRYEDEIKKNAIDEIGGVRSDVKAFKERVKGAKDILKGNVASGIKTILEGNQQEKLEKYQAKAYGKIKFQGEQGRKVSNVDQSLAKDFEGPIKGGSRSKNVNRVNIASYGDKAKGKGLIPFRFKDTFNNKYIAFDAILSGITDTITPEWSDTKYIGRPDKVWNYTGVDRSIGFTFDVFPMTRQEMPKIWEKLNYLVGLCYPNWTQAPTTLYGESEGYKPLNMISPMMELTIGDMYKDTPGFLSSVTITVQDGTTWEYEDKLELPHYLQVTCEYTYIGKYLPNAKGKHFELNWLKDSNDETGTYQDTTKESRINLKEFFSRNSMKNTKKISKTIAAVPVVDPVRFHDFSNGRGRPTTDENKN